MTILRQISLFLYPGYCNQSYEHHQRRLLFSLFLIRPHRVPRSHPPAAPQVRTLSGLGDHQLVPASFAPSVNASIGATVFLAGVGFRSRPECSCQSPIAIRMKLSILSKGITSRLSYRSVCTALGMIISSLLPAHFSPSPEVMFANASLLK